MSNQAEAMAQAFIDALSPVFTAFAAAQPTADAATPTQGQFQDIIVLKDRIAALEKGIDRLRSERDVARAQRDAANEQVAALNKQKANIERTYTSKVRDLQKEVSTLRGQIPTQRHGTLQASYNKLWKDYTAAKNQRDSYAKTIAGQKALIEQLKKESPTEVPYLRVNGVRYSEADILKLRDRNIELTHKLAEAEHTLRTSTTGLIQIGNEVYNADSITTQLNLIAQQDAEIKDMKANYHIVRIGDKFLTPDQVAAIVAENTKLKQDNAAANRALTSANAALVAKRKECLDLARKLSTARIYQFQGRPIPDEDIKAGYDLLREYREGRITYSGITFQLADLPGMADELVRLSNTLKVRDEEIAKLRRIADLTAATAKPPAVVVNDIPLQAGESYMTTPRGMLPINAEGMRKLADEVAVLDARIVAIHKALAP